MPIPRLEANGELPEGIYDATIEEVRKAFGQSSDRRKLLMGGLERAIDQFQKVNVSAIYLDGSFTTDKNKPNDIDGCWSSIGVDESKLHLLDNDFWKFNSAKDAQVGRDNIKKKFGLDFFIAEEIEGASGKPFPEFFQTNRDGFKKGIIRINL
ncbi:MAG: DUF6932 family protein [Bacteriovoracaceae bacterium]